MENRLPARLLRGLERLLLGSDPSPSPSALLVALWAAVLLARLPAALFSLGEDDIWNLVVAVDGPWPEVFFLRGEPFATNHILYTILSKLLIKLSGHHALELVYRLPALAAGALAMPLAFWAGCRLGGPRAGTLASLLYTLAPAAAYHALNARGYMPWSVLALWCLALLARDVRPDFRLGLAYLLLAVSHGLGPVTLGIFLVLGPWLGPPAGTPAGTWRAYGRNLLVSLPALLVSARILYVMAAFRDLEDRFVPGYRPVNTWLYLPQWFEANLGTRWHPALSAAAAVLFALVLILGFRAAWRVHPMRAAALLGLGFGVPFVFAATGEQGGYTRFALGGFSGWALLIALGGARLAEGRRAESPSGAAPGPFPRRAEAALLAASLLLWAPDLKVFWTSPLQVDYLGAARDARRDFPQADTLFGVSKEFATGISYYARRHGMEYRWFGSAAEAEAALAAHRGAFALVWIPQQANVDSSLPPWVETRLRLARAYRSAEMPLQVWHPR